MIEIANNGVTVVLLSECGRTITKKMPKMFCDNECHALQSMLDAAESLGQESFVPSFKRRAHDIVDMDFIESTPITDKKLFMSHFDNVLNHMRVAKVRHGDLTIKAIIPHNNKPMIIDWSESRHALDPRPDKRPDGDFVWLYRAMKELCDAS